jgi:GT2 family glycosyltransferase
MTGSLAPLCVVIPAYNAAEELATCLDSVCSTVPDNTEVIVIDDASPDPAAQNVIRNWRERMADHWLFLANKENQGFVGTANRGMAQTKSNVVLLNSDTVVTPGWLQGLQTCLSSDPTIATATPWTNNGEIVSIPAFCRVNPLPADLAAVAEVIRHSGAARYPDLPTAVGFCMAISRSAIDRLGPFDQDLFGKGYGEENDFSVRASEAGMRNVLCDTVYVAHVGGRSFGPTGLKPDESSMQRLLSRHPGYLVQVQEFISSDPLASRRAELLEAMQRAGVSLS